MTKHQPKITLAGEATRGERQAFAAALRELADFIATSDAPILRSYLNLTVRGVVSSALQDQERRVFESRPRALVRAIGGRVKKEVSQHSDDLTLRRRFDKLGGYSFQAGAVSMVWVINREQVCVAKPTGRKRKIKKYGEYTDPEAAKALQVALDRLTATEEVDVVEWDCQPVLGADEPEAVSA